MLHDNIQKKIILDSPDPLNLPKGSENASNLTNRYLGMFLEVQVDRQIDRQKGGHTTDAKTISLRFHRGETNTEQRINCHVQEHNAVLQVRLEPATHRYLIKHSTTSALLS